MLKGVARHLMTAVALFAAHAVSATPGPTQGSICGYADFEGSRFAVCRYQPATSGLRLYWKDASGAIIGDFDRLDAVLGPKGETLAFAMNAGMYEPDRTPVGLLIAEGRMLSPLNLRSGAGNFYLAPNGVLFADRRGRLHIAESHAFAPQQKAAVWATQSGPMLLRAGRLHPAISADGPSRTTRNGVCTVNPEQAYFLISDVPVSMGRLARFMRDVLHCSDGLHLDGTVSGLWAPVLGRRDRTGRLGPLLAVFGQAHR